MGSNNARELLFSLSKAKGDFVVETFRAGGKGGQNQNKVETGVRIRHPASGAVAECREERSQLQNRKKAFVRLLETKKFKVWHKMAVGMALQGIEDYERELQRRIAEQMRPENLLIEYFDPDYEKQKHNDNKYRR